MLYNVYCFSTFCMYIDSRWRTPLLIVWPWLGHKWWSQNFKTLLYYVCRYSLHYLTTNICAVCHTFTWLHILVLCVYLVLHFCTIAWKSNVDEHNIVLHINGLVNMKKIFCRWIPKAVHIKERMIYASSASKLMDTFKGCKLMQAAKIEDLEAEFEVEESSDEDSDSFWSYFHINIVVAIANVNMFLFDFS